MKQTKMVSVDVRAIKIVKKRTAVGVWSVK